MSNGAGDGLFEVWMYLGEQLVRDDQERAAVDYLRERYENFGRGCRGISFDPPPDELATVPRLTFLGRIQVAFADALTRTPPELALAEFINLDQPYRAFWLHSTLEIHEMVRDALPPEVAPPPLGPRLRCTPADWAELKIHELLGERYLMSRNPSDYGPNIRIALADQILARILEGGLTESRAELITEMLDYRAEALQDLGDVRGAVNTYRAAVARSNDPELREVFTQVADELEKTIPGGSV